MSSLDMPIRPVLDIIPKLIENIPRNEIKFIKELQEHRDNLWNIAPELYTKSDCWIPLGNVLINNDIFNIDHDWKKKLINIFNGIPDIENE